VRERGCPNQVREPNFSDRGETRFIMGKDKGDSLFVNDGFA
jgi:hypothetical protein